MCENCKCCMNGKCFYGGIPGFYCPCEYDEKVTDDTDSDDTRTLYGNGVSWSDFI